MSLDLTILLFLSNSHFLQKLYSMPLQADLLLERLDFSLCWLWFDSESVGRMIKQVQWVVSEIQVGGLLGQ